MDTTSSCGSDRLTAETTRSWRRDGGLCTPWGFIFGFSAKERTNINATISYSNQYIDLMTGSAQGCDLNQLVEKNHFYQVIEIKYIDLNQIYYKNHDFNQLFKSP